MMIHCTALKRAWPGRGPCDHNHATRRRRPDSHLLALLHVRFLATCHHVLMAPSSAGPRSRPAAPRERASACRGCAHESSPRPTRRRDGTERGNCGHAASPAGTGGPVGVSTQVHIPGDSLAFPEALDDLTAYVLAVVSLPSVTGGLHWRVSAMPSTARAREKSTRCWALPG